MLPRRVNSTRTLYRLAGAQHSARASQQRPRTTRRFLRRAIPATLAVCLCLALESGVLARLIFDPADPAFREAILEPFDPSNAAVGATSFTIVRNGVQFTFSTTSV